MQEEITQKEAEITRLQGRLDELLRESPQTTESLRMYDNFIRKAEDDIRKTKHDTENFDASKAELIGKKQINRTFERFNEKLNDIQNEVQNGKDDLEKILKEVFEKTQKQYENSTKTLIENLEDKSEFIMASVEERYKDQKKHLAEAYDRQIAIMNDKINEFTALNARLEKEKELQTQISRVFIANPSLKAEKIMIRSVDIIRQTDLWPRYNTAKSCYDKFVLCSELFSNKEELPKIGSYLDQLKNLLPQFKHIMKCEVHWGDLFDAWGDVKEFARSRDYRQWCGNHFVEDILFYASKRIKGDGVYRGRRDNWMNPNVDYYSHQIGHIIMDDFNRENERRQKHNEELHRQALSINFPAEEFDRLVEQFNVFVSKL